MGSNWEAVLALHQALAVAPQDPMATDLLNKTFELNLNQADLGVNRGLEGWGNQIGDHQVQEVDVKINDKLTEIHQNRVAGRFSRRTRRNQLLDQSGYGESMIVDSDD